MTDQPTPRKVRVVLRPRQPDDPKAPLDEAFAALSEFDLLFDATLKDPHMGMRSVPDEQLETRCREVVQNILDEKDRDVRSGGVAGAPGSVPVAQDALARTKKMLNDEKRLTIYVRLAQLSELGGKFVNWMVGG